MDAKRKHGRGEGRRRENKGVRATGLRIKLGKSRLELLKCKEACNRGRDNSCTAYAAQRVLIEAYHGQMPLKRNKSFSVNKGLARKKKFSL